MEKLLTTILEIIVKTITFFNLFFFFKNNIENKLNPAIPINPVIGDISPVLTLLFISFGLSSLGLIVTFSSLLSTITLYSFISFAFNNGILNVVFSLEDNCSGSDTFTVVMDITIKKTVKIENTFPKIFFISFSSLM